ncbi:MAG: hypothetical protein ACTSYR_05240 [Candidatus Odinarchaeia archaeon]
MDLAKRFSVDKIPAMVVSSRKDYGIRFFTVPSGYEFIPFIDTVIYVSRGDSKLATVTKRRLRELKKNVVIKVFVLLTCPYFALRLLI